MDAKKFKYLDPCGEVLTCVCASGRFLTQRPQREDAKGAEKTFGRSSLQNYHAQSSDTPPKPGGEFSEY